MRNGFTIHDESTAPEASKPLLKGARAKLGFTPNIYGVLAEAPATLQAYFSLAELVGQTGFSPIEQQVVFQAINVDNECTYCVAAHSVISKGSGVPDDVTAALRDNRPIDDPKLEALRTYASKMTRTRGNIGDADFAAFLGAGWTQRHALEINLILAMKTISNYTNHLAETPLDNAFAPQAWGPAAAV